MKALTKDQPLLRTRDVLRTVNQKYHGSEIICPSVRSTKQANCARVISRLRMTGHSTPQDLEFEVRIINYIVLILLTVFDVWFKKLQVIGSNVIKFFVIQSF